MISRTGLPMVDLFFNSFATMIEMQRAFVSGGMMAAPVSSKSKAPIQPQGEIARETSMKQEVETARDTGVRVKDQKKAQVRPKVRRAGGIRAAAGEKSRGLAVIQNPGKRKNHPKPGGDTKPRGTHKKN
jgi:hypothetical protein